jgi:nucleoside-diphosphate-sugar epimerase
MKRVAILGANGQVGTEVSLRLRSVEEIEVVPIARNVSGSAFLRLNGLECRHGRISDPTEVRGLISDCDVVVNLALSNSGIPRIDRQINRQIVHNIVAAAKPGAPIIFASTIMVYAPAMKVRFPDSYGLEKVIAERMFRRLCRASHHPAFVFRLGHVMGELQNITRKICDEIRGGTVALPHKGLRASNTVFTSAIVEAIAQVALAAPTPGTFDLITFPQWSWLDVYRYYADELGLPLQLARPQEVQSSQSGATSPTGLMRHLLGYLANHHAITERLTFLLAFLPRSVNQRVYLRYLQTRARNEINALRQSEKLDLCVEDWRELSVRGFGTMPDPISLMKRYPLPSSLALSASQMPFAHQLSSR